MDDTAMDDAGRLASSGSMTREMITLESWVHF